MYAIKKSSEHKRHKRIVRRIYNNIDKYIPIIREYAINFESPAHSAKIIKDGTSHKERTILVPKYLEQVVHHMCIRVMMPMLTKGMYEHSYASIPERGAHKGKKTIEKWIRNDKSNVKYCLKMDIRHFFDSIPHDRIKAKLHKHIHDKKFLEVIDKVLETTPRGLPLGFYTSQWLANWYLQDLDHFIKERLGAVHYIRYMDDMVIFGSNKRKLHKMKDAVADYTKEILGLTIKDNWQVFRFDYIKDGKHYGRFLDFMGFRFYRDKTTLRKSIMLRATRKAKRISKKKRATVHDLKQFTSYLGWIDCTNTYGMYQKWVKPYLNIQDCKRRISRYDRTKARKRKLRLTKKGSDNNAGI